MIKINQAVIVEGKYDKIKLESILDALIIETEGFGIFKDKEKQRFIKRLAETRGILILTDSDAAGFKIRAFLGGLLPPGTVTHAYIPDILGREKRKQTPSKEGKLGVEGMSADILRAALEKSGVHCAEPGDAGKRLITSADLFYHGLSGRENSREKRRRLLTRLDLPSRLSSNSLLKVLNTFVTYEDFLALVNEL